MRLPKVDKREDSAPWDFENRRRTEEVGRGGLPGGPLSVPEKDNKGRPEALVPDVFPGPWDDD